MLKEFKEFAMKGNVLDMAVGIIIGAAFGTIVNSLVQDVIMPPIGLLLGNVDFSNIFVVLKEGKVAGPYASVAAAKSAGAVTLNFGVFINTIISFLIVALSVPPILRECEQKRGRKGRTAMLSQIIRFIDIGIWEIRLKELDPIKAFLVKYLRIILLAGRGFFRDHCQKTASVLTYYSLLNVVPVVAVAFAISKGFGLERMIEKQILQMAEKANWQADITNQILNFSHNLLDQAKGGLIAGVGVVLLLWTVISILGKIEESLNEIWEVKKSRTLVRKFSDYIAIMVFAPVLMIIASSATVLVASQVKVIVQKIAFLGVFSSVIFFLLNLLPYVSIWVLLTMLYLVMPNTRIPLRSAIVGGIFAGTITQVVQWLYIKFQIGAAGYGAIYGSFAALPLFLAMLQMSWMIVLFGAEVSHANEHYETFGFQPDYSRISISSRKWFALKIFHLLTQKFSRGEKALSVAQIAEQLEIPVRLVRQLLYELIDVGLVVETVGGGKHEVAFQPGQTIENLTVKKVLDAYERRGLTYDVILQSEQAERLSESMKNLSEAIEKAPGNVVVKEIS